MNFETLANSAVVFDVGVTLLHSIWQIGALSIVLFLALPLLHNQTANLRYGVCLSALALTLALPVVTFVSVSSTTEKGSVAARIAEEQSSAAGVERASVENVPLSEQQERSRRTYAGAANVFTGITGWLNRIVPDLLPFAVLIWLVGVAIFGVRLGGGFSHLRRFKTGSTNDIGEAWSQTLSKLRAATGVERHVELLKSSLVETPIAIGFLKPVIIVPASLFLQIHPRELETIIAHELIHIRRYDPVINLVQCVIESLFFYHPGVWWISTQVRREREFAADAAVLEVFEGSHVTYARALANLEEIRLSTSKQTPRYATAANGGNFMQRIQRILKIKTEASTANLAWTAGLACLLTSVFLLAIFSSSSTNLVNAQDRSASKKLAIGFVSIPPVDRTSNAPKDSDATARLLIQKLKEYKVPAIGFLQGGMVSDGEKLFPVRANIARMWRDAGFEIGLGGFQHINLYDKSADEYIANIEKNERVAKVLIGEMGLPPRYFSYPYLNTGKTLDDKAKVEAWLAARGYTSVKYTIDNNEWMYSYAYDMARNDNDVNTMKEIRKAYIDYMTRMFDHYEAYSAEMFGRDIPQTMVLTPSRLITDTADEFFSMVTNRGYSFITVDEAQGDPAYKTREDFTGEAGISWFERWAMAKGNRLRSEPEIDRLVKKTWDDRKVAAKK